MLITLLDLTVIQGGHKDLLWLLLLLFLLMRIDPAAFLRLLRHCPHWCEAGRPLDRVEGHSLLLVVLAIRNRLTHLAAGVATGKYALESRATSSNYLVGVAHHCCWPITDLLSVLGLEDKLACLTLFIFIALPVRVIEDAWHFAWRHVSCHFHAVPAGGKAPNATLVRRGWTILRPYYFDRFQLEVVLLLWIVEVDIRARSWLERITLVWAFFTFTIVGNHGHNFASESLLLFRHLAQYRTFQKVTVHFNPWIFGAWRSPEMHLVKRQLWSLQVWCGRFFNWRLLIGLINAKIDILAEKLFLILGLMSPCSYALLHFM